MQKRWNILPYDEEKANSLQKQLGINIALCNILVQRGFYDLDKAKNYFRPQLEMLHSPWLMKDMDKAVSRIEKAFKNYEKILIYGDYDVDGTTSVAALFRFFSNFYPSNLINFYVPHRYREGYGVSKAGIDFASAKDVKLIICLDCGIKSIDLISYALTLGIDFIICDHHLPDKTLPPASAILNPKQDGCEYPYKELCGCGIGFKLMTALAEHFKISTSQLYCHLDLVATAIAADIVLMTGENRVLAFYGLELINSNPGPGIKALIQLAGIKRSLSITDVVFIIAPRVNAAGRMDDAKKAVQFFIEDDPEKAMEFAEMLHSDNTDRKLADPTITEEALALITADLNHAERKSSVVYKPGWHKGVVGIVASRLIEHYYRPTIVLTRSGELVSGSARSVTGFNLYEAIYECREHLVTYGGHFAAAGLSMLPENVEAFSTRFNEVVSASIADHLLVPEIVIETEIIFSDIRVSLLKIINQMEPFGPGNMRPVFITRNVHETGYSRILKEQHIRFVLQNTDVILNGIGFNMAEKFPLLMELKPMDFVYTIDENEWNGNTTLQLKIIDFRLSVFN
jgi:single-stranded-DNA-specific exonuclease